MNITLRPTSINKATIRVTNEELFRNLLESHADIIWDSRPRVVGDDIKMFDVDTLRKYLCALLDPTQEELEHIFRDGNTVLLLNNSEAMDAIEWSDIAEIIIIDQFNREFTIKDKDIKY